MNLSIADIVPKTLAEGPNQRFAIWFQGCPFRCPSCCNPEYLPFDNKHDVPLEDILDQIKAVAHEIDGITLLGGEPFAHAAKAAVLARKVQEIGLSVMVFSGYVLEDLTSPEHKELLKHTDILVDGLYVKELPDTTRRWIGSTNQKIYFLTDRYKADDPCWRKPNTLEIRLQDGEISINGFPAKQAMGLWKKITLKTVPANV